MNYYLNELKWLVNALSLTLEDLLPLFPENSYIPNELIEHYELIVDIDMNNIKTLLTPYEIDKLEPLHSYLYQLLMSEKYIDCWYDNNFINSKEWLSIRNLSKKYINDMNWKIDKMRPLYSEIVFINEY